MEKNYFANQKLFIVYSEGYKCLFKGNDNLSYICISTLIFYKAL